MNFDVLVVLISHCVFSFWALWVGTTEGCARACERGAPSSRRGVRSLFSTINARTSPENHQERGKLCLVAQIMPQKGTKVTKRAVGLKLQWCSSFIAWTSSLPGLFRVVRRSPFSTTGVADECVLRKFWTSLF